ncbi:MAG: hypothetical protein C0P63_007190 [Actinomycetales bacterium]|uniref:hypothetical protein n=1 Tax=Thermobispora bispora TaxID=2006 RepID=UPI00197DE2FF|nr:hypothetical protein [Thermobispora bispora]MBO2474844.1 hypothetical protein [Actinomycetales bacterium]MDI9582330.1 hypothetical protein [Thermobispora sp.]QSI49479.1 hypothetical protein CYL17_17805 [Thermobispora bispora]
MHDAEVGFEKLADDLGTALDEWSGEFRAVVDRAGLPAKVLVKRLRDLGVSADESRISRWLSGRKQIWSSRIALPGAGLAEKIAEALRLPGADAERLIRLAERVDRARERLEPHQRWRARAAEYLETSMNGAAAPQTGAAPQAATAPAAAVPYPDGDTGRAADRAPAPPADGAVPAAGHGATPRWRRLHGWLTRRTFAVGGAMVALAATVGAAIVVGERPQDPRASGSSSVPATPITRMSSAAPAGLEKGTLGGDSRCSAPYDGPDEVLWRVCARVDADRILFALKIENRGEAPSKVKARLEYVRADSWNPCPGMRETDVLTVAPGQTVVTDPERCTAARQATPFAYQGVGWVFDADATEGSRYRLSPIAHVYPERVIWQPDLP